MCVHEIYIHWTYLCYGFCVAQIQYIFGFWFLFHSFPRSSRLLEEIQSPWCDGHHPSNVQL